MLDLQGAADALVRNMVVRLTRRISCERRSQWAAALFICIEMLSRSIYFCALCATDRLP